MFGKGRLRLARGPGGARVLRNREKRPHLQRALEGSRQCSARRNDRAMADKQCRTVEGRRRWHKQKFFNFVGKEKSAQEKAPVGVPPFIQRRKRRQKKRERGEHSTRKRTETPCKRAGRGGACSPFV